MSELARQRRAKDLWVSRSQLTAAAIAAVLLAAICFFLGYQLGAASAQSEAESKTAFTTPDGELVDVLSRVDATANLDGGVGELTFPDALAGSDAIPEDGEEDAGEEPELPIEDLGEGTVVALPGDANLPASDAVPSGTVHYRVAVVSSVEEVERLKQALSELPRKTWMRAQLVDGEPRFEVMVGGFVDRYQAKQVESEVAAAVRAAGLTEAPELIKL